jgi:hypothetical protein
MRNKLGIPMLAVLAGFTAWAHSAEPASAPASSAPDLGLQATEPVRALERPLRKDTVRLAADKDNPFKRVVTCHVYKSAIVKQIDSDQFVGNLSMSVVSFDGEPPKCQQKIANERLLFDAFTFVGKIGKFGVFSDPDPHDTTMFRVIDLDSGKSVFSDAMYEAKVTSASSTGGDFELRYQRGFKANCSMGVRPSTCWGQVRKATGLSESAVPACGTSPGLSVIGYPAMTMMVDGRTTTIALPGKITCKPES